MKLFRKLTVLALAVLLVCALSAAAFAENWRAELEEFDDGTYILADTVVSQVRAQVYCEIYAMNLSSSTENIRVIYNYVDRDGYDTWDEAVYIGPYDGTRVIGTSTLINDDIAEITSAVYDIYMDFTCDSGYHVLNPAVFALFP